MGRKPKYPEHKQQADKLMNELLDGVVDIWTRMKEPQLGTVADELEMSVAKVRKLLITADERDGKRYYDSSTANRVLRLYLSDGGACQCALKGASHSGLETSTRQAVSRSTGSEFCVAYGNICCEA